MARARRAHTKRNLDLRRPKLALVGESSAIDSVRAALRELRVSIEALPSLEAAPAVGELVGIVLVNLDAKSRSGPKLGQLRDAPAVPVFVVVHDKLSDRSIRKLYEAGAAGVFEWPREALLLGRVLAGMLALRLTRGRAKKPDVALVRTVRTHLKLLPGLHRLPTLESRDGFVTATGSVDTLRLKREVEQTISGVPGVLGLDVEGLHVVATPVSDHEIRRAARRLLQISPEIEARTLTASVEAGQLTLEGSVKSRPDLMRLEELATGIDGIRNLELRVSVSARKHRVDRTAARRLRETISLTFPHENVRVAYFRGIAVLTGETSNLRVKNAIAAFMRNHQAVLRVVNKLEVRGSTG